MLDLLTKFRRELHRYPELSGSEINTADRIKSFIRSKTSCEIIEEVGGHGLVFVFNYGTSSPCIVIRCELDALPIRESIPIHYASAHPGIAHKCGHDGHMAIVAGLSLWLDQQSFSGGQVALLFQPAEETGAGAKAVLDHAAFRRLNPDYLFALHNIPGRPLHEIIVLPERFSASVQSFSILLKGIRSHAAEPDKGRNPAFAVSHIIQALHQLEIQNPNQSDYRLLTPVYSRLGQKAYGISPANAEIHYTIRTWTDEQMTFLEQKIIDVTQKICAEEQIQFEINWFESFPSAQNDTAANSLVLQAANLNTLVIRERPYPFTFGEDFGWFAREYKSAMFGLGSGVNTPALHHTEYDFPDEIIDTGINMFKSIIYQVLNA